MGATTPEPPFMREFRQAARSAAWQAIAEAYPPEPLDDTVRPLLENLVDETLAHRAQREGVTVDELLDRIRQQAATDVRRAYMEAKLRAERGHDSR